MTTRFLVSGLVQGVGFRWFVPRRAQALAFTGWARNLPTDGVEVVTGGGAARRAHPGLEGAAPGRAGASPRVDRVGAHDRRKDEAGFKEELRHPMSHNDDPRRGRDPRGAAPNTIKDHPKPGNIFQDITPVLADAALLHDVIAAMAPAVQPTSGVTHVVGIEARGFILGGAVASALRAPASCRYGSPGSCRGSE